mmetsp:Transcript_12447/g.18854  ORF Transcript_12447/g.18854 Transcript_12447/m.18854 type:complete len:348 (+) Transcript_12447:79-1122(+)
MKDPQLRGGGAGAPSFRNDDGSQSKSYGESRKTIISSTSIPNSISLTTSTSTSTWTSRPKSIPIPLFIPNILCYIRILLAFISVFTVSSSTSLATSLESHDGTQPSHSWNTFVTALLWILASFLDHIDGKIARKLNQCSEFGVVLDIVADNTLRGSAWTCAIIASVERSHGVKMRKKNILTELLPRITPIVGIFFISVEWTTMICTQMLKMMKKKQHWKGLGSDSGNGNTLSSSTALPPCPTSTISFKTSTPKIIQAIFANNFHNPSGALAMYGLFSAGMLTFVFLREHDNILEINQTSFIKIPLYSALIASYAGRMVAMCAEMWLCFDYVRLIIHLDTVDANKKHS